MGSRVNIFGLCILIFLASAVFGAVPSAYQSLTMADLYISGSSVLDNSGNGNHGTNTGGTTGATGKYAEGIYYDGTSDIRLDSTHVGFCDNSGDSFAISLWANISSLDGTARSLIEGHVGSTEVVRVQMTSSTVTFLIRESGGTGRQTTFSPPSTGTFHHYMIIFDNPSNTAYLYIDNSLAGSVSPSDVMPIDNFRVGNDKNLGTNTLIGTISDLVIWDDVLTLGERTEVYEASASYPYTSNTPPNITIGKIEINGSLYPAGYLNGSTIQFKKGFWVFNSTVTDDGTIDQINISLYNSTGLIGTSGTSELNLSSDLLRHLGSFNLSIFANDTEGLESSRSAVFLVVDDVNPYCSGLSDFSTTGYNYTYVWDVSCVDESFFSFNISCTNGFSYVQLGMNLEGFSFSNTSTINSSTSCSYEYCDGHTAETLSKIWYIRPAVNKIEFESDDNINVLESLDGGIISYEKKKDRIEFTVSLDKISPLGTEFRYTTSPNAYYLKDSKFPSHIVDYDARTWFDLSQEYPGYKISVNRWNKTTWLISIVPPKEIPTEEPVELTFRSIGELNCISGTQELTLTPPTSYNIPLFRPFKTLPEALTLIFVYVLWLVIRVLFFTLKGVHGHRIQILNIVALMIGFTAGILTLKYSVIVGLPVLISEVMMFLGTIRGSY